MASRYFLDSDVILDYILKRTPFNVPAREIFQLAFNGKIEIRTSSVIISNIHYLSKKQMGHRESLSFIENFIEICQVLAVGEEEIRIAIKSDFSDFEDAIQHFTALTDPKIKGIVTRNASDYSKSQLPIFSPESFLQLFR